jgi:peptide-methionine (S)-S-oxide reductase
VCGSCFLSLRGILHAEQGWIAAEENRSFSEAVIVHYDPAEINLTVLIAAHLHTHSSTVSHSMRSKYRSALYVFEKEQLSACAEILNTLQPDFEKQIVTEMLTFHAFRPSAESGQNYYYKNPSKPFCQTFIHPKMKTLLEHFPACADTNKINRSGR